MGQGHEQHRCLALNPCHKQNTPRQRLSSAEASDSPSAPRRAGVGARQLTPLAEMSSPRGTGGSPEQRGPPSSHSAATQAARKVQS